MEKENDINPLFKKNEQNKVSYFKVFKEFFLALVNPTPENVDKINNPYTFQSNSSIHEVENSNPVKSKETNQTELKLISSYFDKCIANNSIVLCQELIDEGYQPSKLQLIEFQDNVIERIQKDPEFITKLYKKIQEIPIPILSQFMKFHFDIKTSTARTTILSHVYHDDTFLVNVFHSNLNEMESFLTSLLKNMIPEHELLGKVFDYDQINIKKVIPFFNLIQFNDLLVSKATLKEESLQKYKKTLNICIDKIESYCESVGPYTERHDKNNKDGFGIPNLHKSIALVETHIEKSLTDEHKNMLKKINNVASIEGMESAINKNIKVRSINIRKSLPQEAKDLIEQINTKYQNIRNYAGKNIDMSIIELEILCEKNTVKIIEQYLSMDDAFKESMKDNHGRTAKTIMIDGLKETNSVLDKELFNINQSKMKDLTVSHSVIKSKSMKY